MSSDPRQISVLSIAGSDSGGGAGIQADLKTIAAHGLHGLCAITALTAQNTQRVSAVHVPPADFLRAQIDACLGDFDVRAVKTGMLANAELIATVHAALDAHPQIPLVLDPVMIATSGARLLDNDALDALRRLATRATVLTPNVPEAEWLLARSITDADAADAALSELLTLGCTAVLLKGAHLHEAPDQVCDRYREQGRQAAWRHPRMACEGHGSGCTLAAAVAARLALGEPALRACQQATDYVAGALAHACAPGRGALRVLDHFWQCRGEVAP